MNINLGKEISRRRREQRLTQEDLAELSDLSVNFISRLERTKNQNISIHKLDSIARALNTTTPEIINSVYHLNEVEVKHSEIITNTPILIQKVTNELRKLPKLQAEHLSKAFITILKEMDNGDNKKR